MNKLVETNNEYTLGLLEKGEYIEKMYNIHSILYDYAEFIERTNISRIEIIDNLVLMTFRNSGIRFICTKNDKRLAPLDTLNFGNYEKEEMEMQLKLIEDDFNIIDIGGNYGWYAMHIAKNKPNANIFSFEPISDTFNYLNENIRLNNLENIKTFNFGFSDTEEPLTFFLDPSLSVNASLANVSDNSKIENITCNVKRLDSFIKEQNIKVDFIKCDVEGAEYLVFKGGIEVIKKNCPIIFTEMLRKWSAKFNYHPNDIILFFQNLDYECYTLIDGKLKVFDLVDDNTQETNYFFLHKKKHVTQIERFFTI